MGRVPTICLSGLSEAQRRACIIADNQLALNAGWDAELLKIELAEGLTDPDDAPAAPEHPVSEPGDLWILERHRLLCARWREWCSDPHRRGWRGGAAVALLLVHCRAGVSRSTAAAALILMQANPEWPASAALDAVAAIRPRLAQLVDPPSRACWRAHLAVKSRKRLAGRPPDSGLSHLILRGIVRPSVILLQPCRIDQKRAAISR